jgi:ribokinase
MSGKVRVVILGDILYDCFVWADRLPRVGETVTGYANGFYSGGKGANQAVQAARLGAETIMIGKVGADERGDFLIRSLKESGVNTDCVIVDKEIPTGTDCVHIARDGSNAIVVVPLANEHIHPEEIAAMADVIRSADVFISQLQVNKEAIEAALTICREAGVKTVLNPAPARKIPDTFFEMADYMTPNETECEFFTGLYQKDMEPAAWRQAAAKRFSELGARRLIVTLGANGALYSDGAESFVVPPYPVKAVDSTAAGDAFNAAFAIKIAQGADIKEALRYGNAAGAVTATRMGSQPALPTAEEVDRFIAERQ